MKKSFLILAVAAMTFASCKKSSEAEMAPDISLKSSTLLKHGADDGLAGGREDRIIAVPAKVLAAFAKGFPGAPVREWRFTNKGLYKAHFLRNGIAWEASYRADGTLVKSERA
ncbi:MAG: hypothetical protein H7Y07_12915 [Pyrinomonadaceae bacterium]|nr:hypothetical protein [Sphingobacteriaceae bacterium]